MHLCHGLMLLSWLNSSRPPTPAPQHLLPPPSSLGSALINACRQGMEGYEVAMHKFADPALAINHLLKAMYASIQACLLPHFWPEV